MPLDGPIPQWLFTTVAAATVFTIMFDLGLAIVPREFRWVAAHPGLLARAIFAVLIAVPAVAWVVCRALDLPRVAEIGIMLMSIAPGAPVALRRSIGAGGHRSFAPALQIAVVTLGVVTMPLFIAFFDEYYAATATIDARHLARQVLVAQLLPLAAGMAVGRVLTMLLRRTPPAAPPPPKVSPERTPDDTPKAGGGAPARRPRPGRGPRGGRPRSGRR
jgi:BASS family bile acid:Na+ symporter